MSPTRRSPSPTSRSYLHQLAMPLPSQAKVLTPRRPLSERGPRNVLDSIPPIIESLLPDSFNDSFNNSPDSSPTHRFGTIRTSRASASSESLEARARSKESQPDQIASNSSSRPPQPPILLSKEFPSANRIHETFTPLLPTPSSQREYTTSNPAPSTRTQPIEIHIGTVEVRLPAPPPPPDPKPVPRDLNSVHSPARPARPISRGITWTFGLVQG
jgi:hypothetical protein